MIDATLQVVAYFHAPDMADAELLRFGLCATWRSWRTAARGTLGGFPSSRFVVGQEQVDSERCDLLFDFL